MQEYEAVVESGAARRGREAGYLTLSRALFVWGCVGGISVAILAMAVWANGVRPDAAELRGLALLVAFELCALSICASILVRVIGDSRRRIALSAGKGGHQVLGGSASAY